MAYDAATMAAVVRELEPFAGGRIDRVYQTGREEIVLSLYHRGEKGLLLCSAAAAGARAHLTARLPERPPTPPPFCMLLRRHLEGQRLLGAAVEPGERVLRLTVAARDDLGEPVTRHLVVEVMGRHSNIILLHPDGRVADAIKRVGPDRSRRPVVPGTPYEPPPPAGGLDPTGLQPEHLAAADPALPLWRALVATIRGAGPTLARQACLRAGLDPARPAGGLGAAAPALLAAVQELAGAVATGRFCPNLLEGPSGEVREYWVLPLLGPGLRREFPSAGAMLDHVHAREQEEQASRRLRERVEAVLRRDLARLDDLAAGLDRDLAGVTEADQWRRWGELLTANLYRLKERGVEALLADPLDPEAAPVAVPLDPQLSPAENAQRYFDRHARARRAEKALHRRQGEVVEERAYLAAQLDALLAGDEPASIAGELAARGYRIALARPGQRRPGPRPPFARYRTTDGLPVLVGRSNRENEELTFHHARPGDIWLHTREIPGSHVILKSAGPPPAASLQQAALIAAWHSRARRSSRVPVDYTERRNVRKPTGAPPGKVVYHGQKTIYVTPTAEAIRARLES